MNYMKVYVDLIHKAQERQLTSPLTCYKENHHIIPKSLGGGEEESNRVNLLPEEHYIAHHLLWKIFPNGPMTYAFRLMVMCEKYNVKITSKVYKSLKEDSSNLLSKLMSETNKRMFESGTHVSQRPEFKQIVSIRNKILSAEGRHNFQSEKHREFISNRINSELLNGTHVSQRPGFKEKSRIIMKRTAENQLRIGTHPSQINESKRLNWLQNIKNGHIISQQESIELGNSKIYKLVFRLYELIKKYNIQNISITGGGKSDYIVHKLDYAFNTGV